MRVGIAGIMGRIGQLLVEEIRLSGFTLSGGTMRLEQRSSDSSIIIWPTISDLAKNSDLIIDFTHPSTVKAHASALLVANIPWVLGTSGLTDYEEAIVQRAAESIPVVYAASFSPSITLMMALAKQIAATLPANLYDAEILELHHNKKKDAPSGTAIALGKAIASGRHQNFDTVKNLARNGFCGSRVQGEIGFASLRAGNTVGEHTILFASDSEHLSINHRSYDRRIYAQGALKAGTWLQNQPAGLYDMSNVLGLTKHQS